MDFLPVSCFSLMAHHCLPPHYLDLQLAHALQALWSGSANTSRCALWRSLGLSFPLLCSLKVPLQASRHVLLISDVPTHLFFVLVGLFSCIPLMPFSLDLGGEKRQTFYHLTRKGQVELWMAWAIMWAHHIVQTISQVTLSLEFPM